MSNVQEQRDIIRTLQALVKELEEEHDQLEDMRRESAARVEELDAEVVSAQDYRYKMEAQRDELEAALRKIQGLEYDAGLDIAQDIARHALPQPTESEEDA